LVDGEFWQRQNIASVITTAIRGGIDRRYDKKHRLKLRRRFLSQVCVANSIIIYVRATRTAKNFFGCSNILQKFL